jgi:nucleoside-diphosphate-sugar epimerase
MDHTAQTKYQILITDIGSFLGTSLAQNFLGAGHIVYGAGKSHPNQQILEDSNFTLLDIDLSQPIPTHLPNFDHIIHLSSESLDENQESPHLTAISANIIKKAKDKESKVIFLARIGASSHFFENFILTDETKDNLKLFLLGDVYGPAMHTSKDQHLAQNTSYYDYNNLTALVSQAIRTDKVILEKEGLTIIYPTYIDDVVHALNKYIDAPATKNMRFIVSSSPITSLSAAYIIQNSAHLNLQKEVNLFFAGPQTHQKPKAEPLVRSTDLGFSPRYNFSRSIDITLSSFEDKDLKSDLKTTTPIISTLNINTSPNEEAPRLKLKNRSRFFLSRINFKAKTIILLIVIGLLALIVKTGIDLKLGANSLKNANQYLTSGDFKKAKNQAQNAQSSFLSSKTEFDLLTKPLAYIMPKKVKALSAGLESAQLASLALNNFIEGIQVLSVDLENITSSSDKKTDLNLEDAQAALSKAYFQASYAMKLSQQAQTANFSISKLKTLESNLKSLSNYSQTALDLTSLITDFTGTNSKKNYLVLLLNNAELRPGGGFIGNFGEISFDNGKLKDINIEDIYTIDGQLKEKISPPPQLTQKLGVDKLYLRDSNWSTDFALNAATARDFYKKETGKTVNGVFALDLTFVQQLLDKIGPIKLDDYNETITAANLFDKGEYYAEVGFFPGSTQKKDFFAALTRKLISRLIDSLASQSSGDSHSPWLALVTAASQSLEQKHLLLAFDSPALSSYAKSKNWSNLVPPSWFDPTDDAIAIKDFVALSEANVGANKVNRYLERAINYEMTIGRDADLMAKLTITYKNNSPADTWPGGTYVNYLRVYAPLLSSLESYQIDGKTIDKPKNPQKPNPEDVLVATEGNLTTFASLVEVPVGKTKTVTYIYRIPKNIKLETAPAYSLYIDKQPGTEKDKLNFAFNLPSYLKIDSINDNQEVKGKQIYSTSTDLSQDRQFNIKISKK